MKAILGGCSRTTVVSGKSATVSRFSILFWCFQNAHEYARIGFQKHCEGLQAEHSEITGLFGEIIAKLV